MYISLTSFHFYIFSYNFLRSTLFKTCNSLSLHHSFLCLRSPCHPIANTKQSLFNPLPTALYICCFKGSEYHDSLGIRSHQRQFLHALLYQNKNNPLDAEPQWPIPQEPNCRTLQCCCTFKSSNICILKTVFLLKVLVLHPKSMTSSSP
jgi:hypothetical protein